MKVPVVKQCCCGCSLETGTVIIGWLDLVFGVLGTVGVIIALVSPDSAGSHKSTASLIIALIAGFVSILVAIMLLIGVKRRIPRYIQFWIIISFIVIVVNVLTSLGQGITLAINSQVGQGLSVIIVSLLVSALALYLVIVVFNFKREISGDNQHV